MTKEWPQKRRRIATFQQIQTLDDTNAALQDDNARLEKANADLRRERDMLRQKIKILQVVISVLLTSIAGLAMGMAGAAAALLTAQPLFSHCSHHGLNSDSDIHSSMTTISLYVLPA